MTVYVRWVQKKGRAKRWLEYHIKNRHPNGDPIEERRKSLFTSEAATRKWAENRERELLAEGPTKGPAKKCDTLRAFSKRWLDDYCVANRHKPSGIQHKRIMLDAHLLKHLGDKRLNEITVQDVQEIKTRLADRSPKTVNNALVVLSKMLRVAIEWGELDAMPPIKLLRVERKARPFLSVDRYNALIVGAEAVSKECLALVLLAGDAGLRRGEIFALQWNDVDFARRLLVVQRSRVGAHTGSTKGNAVRHVPMTQALIDALSALPRGRRVFVLPGLTVKSARELVEEAEREAELEVTGKLHILRHTFASHIAMAGESLYHLQAAMGHVDHQTTQGYAHLAPEALGRLTEGIDRMRGRPPQEVGRHKGDKKLSAKNG